MQSITIVGSGFVGSLLALALAKAKIPVEMIDSYDLNRSPATDGRVSSLAFTSVELLKALDIWPLLQPFAQPITKIDVGEYQRPSLLSFGFPLDTEYANPSCTMGYMIENTHLKQTLWQLLKQESAIRILSPATVTQMRRQNNEVMLTLNTGQDLTTHLVIGADGHQSTLRSLANIRFFERSYNQKALVTTVEIEQPHQGTAFEQFLPNGPFALLPLLHNRMSLVWCDVPEIITEAVHLDKSTLTAALNRRFKNPALGTLYATDDPRWTYDLAVKFSLRPYSERCVVIGDAAHSIHPVAGQGLNLGIRDVAVLTECLINALSLGLDIGSWTFLQQYAQQRFGDTALMTAGTDSLVRLCSNHISPLRLIRQLGMTAVNHLPMLKNSLRNYAMGLKKPLPLLLQGKRNFW